MLEIMDTAGTESFLAMRDLYIKNAQAFILVYSITSRSTFKEVEQIKDQIMYVKDYQEAGSVPLVLAGNKCDLEQQRQVSYEEGENLAKTWGNCCFMETSAKNFINIENMFEEVTKQVLSKTAAAKDREVVVGANNAKKKKKCTIL